MSACSPPQKQLRAITQSVAKESRMANEEWTSCTLPKMERLHRCTSGETSAGVIQTPNRKPLHLQLEQFVTRRSPQSQFKALHHERANRRKSRHCLALLMATSCCPLRSHANEIAGGTLATVIQSPRKPQSRNRFVSAAALILTSSLVFDVEADEKKDVSFTPLPGTFDDLRGEKTDANDAIGDGIRSEESSSHFFESIDSDGDGIIEAPELATIVRESISETPSETIVEDEVSRVLHNFGTDEDKGVESADVYAYWMQLESLLTVDEVAEWIVHAVQMPESVGQIFRENFVTGYDFPELVENRGEALLSELHIEKSSFRKKIVRHVVARLLAIGTVPTAPSEVMHRLESCSTVSFKWEKSSASGFPVHSYRVQRRTIDLLGSDSLGAKELGAKRLQIDNHSDSSQDGPRSADESCEQNSTANGQCSATTDWAEWVTVYVGSETEFLDTSLEIGKSYIYRFQAWNSVGRSASWTTVDIAKSLKKQKCSAHNVTFQNHDRSVNETTMLGFLYWGGETLIHGSYIVLQLILSVIAVASAVMRFKRASAKSTAASDYQGVPPSFWAGLNAFFARVLGVEVVSSAALGENSTLHRSKTLHDRSVNAVGLNGYKHDDSIKGDPQGRRLAFQKSKPSSVGDVSQLDGSFRSKPFKNVSFRLPACQDACNGSSRPESRTETCVSVGSIRDLCSLTSSRESSVASQDSDSGGELEDDDNRCNTCRKTYKFGKRWRHHCARCMSTFCHKHGRTTHSNLTACKVPGSCICDVCLALEDSEFQSSGDTAIRGGKRWLSRRQRSMEAPKDGSEALVN